MWQAELDYGDEETGEENFSRFGTIPDAFPNISKFRSTNKQPGESGDSYPKVKINRDRYSQVQPGVHGSAWSRQNQNAIPGSTSDSWLGASDLPVGHYGGVLSQCKDQMRFLPKWTHPPEQVLFKAPPIPEANAVVTWSFQAEYEVTIEYKENTMGYFPLDLSEVLSGWCGDNAFGMLSGLSRMDYVSATQEVGLGYMWSRNQWRNKSFAYNAQYDNYPTRLLTRSYHGSAFHDVDAA